MNNQKSREDIKYLYYTIDDNFTEIYSACENDKQKKYATLCRDAARDAYRAAEAVDLSGNSEFVNEIRQDLKKLNVELSESLQEVKDISRVLNTMKDTVRLAASLVTLGLA